jgi:hypothetical protein
MGADYARHTTASPQIQNAIYTYMYCDIVLDIGSASKFLEVKKTHLMNILL